MSLHPLPADLVAAYSRVQLHPEIFVEHVLLGGCAPAVALPFVDPLADAELHVLRIDGKGYFGGLLQRFQSADHSRQLHAVVCGFGIAAVDLAHAVAEAQHASPSAW